MNAAVTLTDNAAKKVYEFLEEDGNLQQNLRLSITGGGCNGFSYDFSFDETIDAENDCVVEKTFISGNSPDTSDAAPANEKQIRLIIDYTSLQYLTGATIDYKEDVQGGSFVINNPQVKTTCGCGSSFSM